MKRILVALVVACMGAVAHADTAIRATGTANVRSGPGTGYGLLGQVPTGHVYVSNSQSGSWRQIYWNGGMGWTHEQNWVTMSGLTATRITADVLNVRSSPAFGNNVVGQVYLNQKYIWTRHAAIDPWYEIYWQGQLRFIHEDWVQIVSVGGGSSPPPPPSSGTITNLAGFPWYGFQPNGYYCGPASGQLVVKWVTGNFVSVWTLGSQMGTAPGVGTSVNAYVGGINMNIPGTGSDYYTVWANFQAERARRHIRSNLCVPINPEVYYLGYWGYSFWAGHYCVIRGYTSGGFRINDTGRGGADQWASDTEVWNAVHYNNVAWFARIA